VLLDNTGHQVWSNETFQPVSATPLWDEEHRLIIVIAQSGRIQAFDRTGHTRWTQGIDGTIQADPILHQGSIYAVDENGTLTALDSASGDIRWEFGSQAQPTWSATVSQNSIAIANENEIWLVNALGNQIGHIQSENTAPPTLVGTDLYTVNNIEVRIWDTTARMYHPFALDSIRQATDTDREPLRVIQPATLSSQGLWWGDTSGRILALRIADAPPLLPVRWQRNTLEADFNTLAFEYASIANDSLLAVSDRFNTLFYVNTKDGSLQQQHSVPGGRILAMTASHDTEQTLLLQDDGITAYTANTDQPLWRLALTDITGGMLSSLPEGDWLAWVQARRNTYQFLRFNAQGDIAWQLPLTGDDTQRIIHGGELGFVAGTTAVDLRNGDQLWQSAVPLQAAFILDTTVCGFQDEGGITLRCLNRSDGSIDHITPTTLTTLPQQSIPSNDGAFVATPDHLVSWIDALGNLRWQSRPETVPIVHMQLYKQHALVVRNDGRIQLFAPNRATPIAVVNDLPINYTTNILPGWRDDFPLYNDMLFLTSNNSVYGIDMRGVVDGE